ncbi:MAG: solute symporter family protein [Anaerolineae bacterium]
MRYEASPWAISIFIAFVGFVLWISYYFARRTHSAKGYFAAGGRIHWSVNGIAFAGDYLSAASFLGIAGMIAAYGYDGFLYSIGYLAGWIVALFVVAEPLKRKGKYTFTDALDSTFNSKGIQLVAAISTLVVSTFYLIPQMVGAGALVTPLLGLPHWAGVAMVGSIVIVIVATAGMASTTYVQFLKGGLLIVFSTTLVISLFARGFSASPDQGGDVAYHQFQAVAATVDAGGAVVPADAAYQVAASWPEGSGQPTEFVKLSGSGGDKWFHVEKGEDGAVTLTETLWVTSLPDGGKLYNGAPQDAGLFYHVGNLSRIVQNGHEVERTGTLDVFSFLTTMKDSTVVRWGSRAITEGSLRHLVYYQVPTAGVDVMRPGLMFKVDSDRGAQPVDKLNFVSLMLALFLGTSALPHILIRYYTVPTPADARKSTIVAIAAIGFFYVLTLYMGLGAMASGVIDLTDSNMSAPLLAKSFGVVLFAIISAIAFATVLGTVSGLIVAASGAVAHDLMDRFLGMNLTDKAKVRAGKISAVAVGVLAMGLGVAFEGMNVSYLVGWAFAVAASANLPAIVMLLFWKRTTSSGIVASIIVGMVSAVGLILLSPDMYVRYGLPAASAPFGLNNPGIVSIPLGFITLVVVSLLTRSAKAPAPAVAPVAEGDATAAG